MIIGDTTYMRLRLDDERLDMNDAIPRAVMYPWLIVHKISMMERCTIGKITSALSLASRDDPQVDSIDRDICR
eukprot:scaffold202169_cov19-Prasinocladus_malaysianus.AAC.1